MTAMRSRMIWIIVGLMALSALTLFLGYGVARPSHLIPTVPPSPTPLPTLTPPNANSIYMSAGLGLTAAPWISGQTQQIGFL